jgi:hypothetical protein
MRPRDRGRQAPEGKSNCRISLKCSNLVCRDSPDTLRMIRSQITNCWNSTASFCRQHCAGHGALTFLFASRRCDSARHPSESLVTLKRDAQGE